MIHSIKAFVQQEWTGFGLGPTPASHALSWLLINGSTSTASKLVWLGWRNKDSLPCLTVKFARYLRYNYRIKAEYNALQQLNTHLRNDPGHLQVVARPLAATRLDGLEVTIETALTGRIIPALLQEQVARPGRQVSGLASLLNWLIHLHLKTATLPTPAQLDELVFKPLLAALTDLNLSASEKEAMEWLMTLARSNLAQARALPLPLVFNHNDLGPFNVLVGRAGDLTGLLDWEFAARGLPLSDLFYFLNLYGRESGLTKGAGQNWGSRLAAAGMLEGNQQRANLSTFNNLSLFEELARSYIHQYCQKLAISRRWLPVLMALTLIQHARNEQAALSVNQAAEQAGLTRLQAGPILTTTGDVKATGSNRLKPQGYFRSELGNYLIDLFNSKINLSMPELNS